MDYNYFCKGCGNKVIISVSMSKKKDEYFCENCGGLLYRDFKIDFPATIIPEHMRATAGNKINYNQSPSGKKHFW